MERRDFIAWSLLLGLGGLPLSAVEIEPVSSEIPLEKALFVNCLQRTQTQQLLKEYLMAALNSSYKNPKQELPKSVEKYDRRFRILYDYFVKRIKQPEARKKMEEARSLWEESKKLLLAPPSQENALKLQKNFQAMIRLLSAPKVLKVKKSFKAVAKTGSLCRDPLYMSNLYLMKLWGIRIPDYEERMRRYITHFRDNLQFLEHYPENTPEVDKLLKEAGRNFIFFEMMYRSKRTAIPTLISKKADDIFTNIQRIKQIYGQMIR